MRRLYFLIPFILLSSCEIKEKVIIKKVEHFYISSHNAKELFNIFSRQIGLPVVWDYQNWGSFVSGGISLGNVVVEFVESSKEQETNFFGIALEPDQSLKKIIPILDSLNISHGNKSEATDWSTISLNNMLPEKFNLFLCDYHDRKFVNNGRRDAAEKLEALDGGPLGILFLKEIIISSERSDFFLDQLLKLPGILRTGNTVHFSEGPDIKLLTLDDPILGLLIKVKSLHKAQAELDSINLKVTCTEQGLELDQNIFGVNIVLFE